MDLDILIKFTEALIIKGSERLQPMNNSVDTTATELR